RGIETGAELARNAADFPGIQYRAASHELRRHRPALPAEMHFHHGHRGNRPQVMRVKNAEQRLSDLRKFIVDLEVNAGRKKRERFEQAFDMWVRALIRLEKQTARDSWIFFREFRAKLAEEIQLPVVIELEFVTHFVLRGLGTRR